MTDLDAHVVPPRPRGSRLLTWLLTPIAIGLLLAAAVYSRGDPPEASFTFPGTSAILSYDTELDIVTAAFERHPLLARVFAAFGMTPDATRADATRAYDRLVGLDDAILANPVDRDRVRAYLAVLLLEGGRTNEARDVLQMLDRDDDDLVALLDAAYPKLALPNRAAESPLA